MDIKIITKRFFFASAVAGCNIFLLWILISAINSFQWFDALMMIGITFMADMGFWVMFKGLSRTVISSQKNIFDKILLLFLVPASFALFAIGALGIVFQENFSAGLMGIIFGIIIGFSVALIAYNQELPKWRLIGFSKAKTPEEKKIMAEIQRKRLPETEKLLNRWYLAYLMIEAVIFIILGGYNFDSLITASVFFVISLIGSYIILAVLADKKIRKEFKK